MFLYNLTLGRPSGIQVRQWLAKLPGAAAATVPCLTSLTSCSLPSTEPSQSLTPSCTRLSFHVAKCWSCCAQMRVAECRQSTPLMSLVSSGEKAPVRKGYLLIEWACRSAPGPHEATVWLLAAGGSSCSQCTGRHSYKPSFWPTAGDLSTHAA